MSPTPDRLTLHDLSGGEAAIENILDQAMEGQEVHRNQQLRHICAYLSSQGAAAAVWQRNVQDPDFLAEHATYYAKWSFNVPRFCNRLHFFATAPASHDVLDAVQAWSNLPDAYLGFVTLRPVLQCPVGATFLRCPRQEDRCYVHARDRFPVHLAGCRFDVEATPFMQQDNAVGACAQAAVWMGLRTLRWREGRSALTPAQITSSATRFVVNGRTLPNRQGLRLEQMTEVVRSAGYAPHLIELRSLRDIGQGAFPVEQQAQVYRKLYPYVESGIPIVLVLIPRSGGHAVVVVGHQWSAGEATAARPILARGPRDVEFVDASAWAQPFLIHNDNTGPYLPLPTQSVANEYALQHAAWAIPLLSADILVDAEEAQTTCLQLITHFFCDVHFDWPKQVVPRTRLMTRAKF